MPTNTSPPIDACALLKPEPVVVREVAGEAVLLDLRSERYFGLDEVGARMWHALVDRGSIAGARDALADVYAVEPAVLARDLAALAEELVAAGLLQASVPEEVPS